MLEACRLVWWTELIIFNSFTVLAHAQRLRTKTRSFRPHYDTTQEQDEAKLVEMAVREISATVRAMIWFFEGLLSHVQSEVIEPALNRVVRTLEGQDQSSRLLDFEAIKTVHSIYLSTIMAGSLLGSKGLSTHLSEMMHTCSVLCGQVDRWDGDILPSSTDRQDEVESTFGQIHSVCIN